MSFVIEQKREVIETAVKNLCCRRATLLGALASRATSEGESVHLRVNGDDVIKYFSSLIFEIYGKEPSVKSPESGGRIKVLSFDSKSAAKYLSNISRNNLLAPKCASCRSSFLRGAFLASGKLSDPSKEIFAELSPLEDRIELFLDFLGETGLEFSLLRRRGVLSGIYSKNSETVEDFFAMTGMNSTFFTLMHEKINKESRNNANRVSNCEMNNIAKSVDAAARQIELITELEQRGLLGALSEELLATARLRLQHTDMSLAQLAMASNPPISKSGLSHRLKKITEMAEKILRGKLDDI